MWCKLIRKRWTWGDLSEGNKFPRNKWILLISHILRRRKQGRRSRKRVRWNWQVLVHVNIIPPNSKELGAAVRGKTREYLRRSWRARSAPIFVSLFTVSLNLSGHEVPTDRHSQLYVICNFMHASNLDTTCSRRRAGKQVSEIFIALSSLQFMGKWLARCAR